MKLTELYPRFKDDVRKTVADEGARMQIQFRWVIKILVLFCLGISAASLLMGQYQMTAIMAILTLVLFGNYWIVYLLKNKGVWIVTILLNIEFVGVYGYVLISGASDGFAATGLVILPLTTIILTGRWVGSMTCGTAFLMLIFFLWTPFGSSFLQYDYNRYFRNRFPFIFLIVYVLTFLADSLRALTVSELQEERRRVELVYQKQYENLHDKIQEARKVRHDTRHHFAVIDTYLSDGKIEEAREYIQRYYKALPFEESLIYCEHYGINALLTYIAQRAKASGVECGIKVNFPSEIPIPDEDLTVIFGNLLENALDASKEGADLDPDFEAKIVVKGNYGNGMLLFSVENRAIRKAKRDQKNRFLSTKHSGFGIGIDSVRGIAEKHNGSLKIEEENGTFKATVMLM